MAPVGITQLFTDFSHPFVRIFQKIRSLLQQKGSAVIRQSPAGVLLDHPVDVVAVIIQFCFQLAPADPALSVLQQLGHLVEKPFFLGDPCLVGLDQVILLVSQHGNETAEISPHHIIPSGTAFTQFQHDGINQPVKIIGIKEGLSSEIDILLCTVKGKLLVFRKQMMEKSMAGTDLPFLILQKILFQYGFDIFLLEHEKNDFKLAVMQLLMTYIFVAQAAFPGMIGHRFIFNL